MNGPANSVAPIAGTDATWIRSILPNLEQQTATWDKAIAVLACPADPRAGFLYNPIDQHGYTSYLAVAGLEIYDDLGIMFAESRVRATDVSDGLSNTLLAAERPPVMMGDLWGWGWWESYDAGDVQIGMKVTVWYQHTSCDSSPQYFGPGAAKRGPGFLRRRSDVLPRQPFVELSRRRRQHAAGDGSVPLRRLFGRGNSARPGNDPRRRGRPVA